jgi:hypothetical protein
MIKIAFYISGRITCYENCLIPILKYLEQSYEIYLFISLNSKRTKYHLKMEKDLEKWLKDIYYEEYQIPLSFIENTHPETLFQIVNNKKVPLSVLSCFYNDTKNFQLIENYEKKYNLEFDIYCKFRPDLIFKNINDIKFIKSNKDELVIYSAIIPKWAQVHFFGYLDSPLMITDNFVYSNKKIMKLYTDTYNYILSENNKYNGFYRINYETALTENIIDYYFLNKHHTSQEVTNKILNNKRGIKINYFNNEYELDKNRRNLDNFTETAPHRIKNSIHYCI